MFYIYILFTFRTCVTYILIYVLLKKIFFFFLKSQKSTKLKIGHATIYKIIIFINHFPKHRSIMLFVNCSWVRNYFIGWFMWNLSIDMYELKILHFDISSWVVFWCFWFISFSLIICVYFTFELNSFYTIFLIILLSYLYTIYYLQKSIFFACTICCIKIIEFHPSLQYSKCSDNNLQVINFIAIFWM